MVEIRDRVSVTMPVRLKRRLKMVADDKDITMNDLILTAINDYLDRLDAHYQAPDLVADRLSQILMTQMAMNQRLEQMELKIGDEYDGY